MDKQTDRCIEWLVALVVVNITTITMFRALMETLDYPFISRLVLYFSPILVGLIFIHQNKHYGIKVYDKFFWWFYVIYCLYILLDMTILRRYPLENMQAVPSSLSLYFFYLFLSLGYLLCAPTIYNKFNLKKYLFLSFLICTIPSVLFVNYVGVDFIQTSRIGRDDEEFIPTLVVTYANVPSLVIAVMNFKTLLNKKWMSVVISSIIIASVIYVLFAYGKRGPILWSIVSIFSCYFVTSANLKKYFFIVGIVFFVFVSFLDPIIDGITDILPKTGAEIAATIKEGETDHRFNLDDPEESTYLMGLENFSKSPIWGEYCRLEKPFEGAYPHNVFIEILMTMGLLGFIPFMLLLLKAYKKSRKIFTQPHTTNQMAFFILFISVFLQLQTSGSVVFKFNFWLFFYMLCCIDYLQELKEYEM